MNELKLFENTEFGELSVMTIDGKEYFPATQCAKVLGYANPQEAIRTHCKGVRKTLTPSNGGSQQINYVPEGDLYRLIIRSKLPAAERFERWVFDVVLPTMRKSGGYISNMDEIISKTVTATLKEVLKHFAPGKQTIECGFNNEMLCEVEPRTLKRRKKPASVIAKLEYDLKTKVEEMIASELYSYREIQEYLRDNGIGVSIGAICRYAHKLYYDI